MFILYLGYKTEAIARDVKMGQARRAGPPACQKKGGSGWNFQPANPLWPGPPV